MMLFSRFIFSAVVAVTSSATMTGAINVHSGRTFVIHLPYNAGTGYSWQIVKPLPKQIGVVHETTQAQGNAMPGGRGTASFTLRMSSAGTAHVTFVYVRPWEHGVPPAKKAVYTIDAQ